MASFSLFSNDADVGSFSNVSKDAEVPELTQPLSLSSFCLPSDFFLPDDIDDWNAEYAEVGVVSPGSPGSPGSRSLFSHCLPSDFFLPDDIDDSNAEVGVVSSPGTPPSSSIDSKDVPAALSVHVLHGPSPSPSPSLWPFPTFLPPLTYPTVTPPATSADYYFIFSGTSIWR